jgi:putative transcription factor
MRCEVCGREIFGEPYYRIIEGGRMTVCSRCSSFGSADWDPKKPRTSTRRRRTPAGTRPRPRSEIDVAEQLLLFDDYGILIKKARQKKSISIEDFAKKINEKESVIKKLEKSQMNPPTNLVRKIERELGIKLYDSSPVTRGTQVLSRPRGPRTLGDLIKIKPQKEKEA